MYYLAPHPSITPARITLARTKGYSTFDGAFADMGTGVVFTESGDLAAYHERHAYLVERRGVARMVNA